MSCPAALVRMIRRHCVVTGLLLLVSLSARAQDDSALGFELTPFGGYRFGGSFDVAESTDSYELQDGSSFGLILNWRHSGETKWEILYSKQQTEAEFVGAANNDPVVGVDLQALQLGGMYFFAGDTVQPYLAATLGGTHASARSSGSKSDTFFSGSLGAGVLIGSASRFGLRLEARAYGTLARSNTNLFCRTGPDANVCAFRAEGDLLSQVETFAGVVFRF